MVAILKVHNYRLSNNNTSIALLCENNLLSHQHRLDLCQIPNPFKTIIDTWTLYMPQ